MPSFKPQTILARKALARAKTPEEAAAAAQIFHRLVRMEHEEARLAKQRGLEASMGYRPAVSKRIQHSGAEERLAYLERAERGGAVNRSHCPPFEPVGRRLQRAGLLTLVRKPVAGARCSHSIVVLTPAGVEALAKLRKRMGIAPPQAESAA